MELFIETLTGTGYELRVSPFEPILSVKAKIQRLGGIPVSQQHLIWQSIELEDDYNLDDYKIHDGATLKLVLAMRGGPINTRRIPMEDPSFREMAEYVEANKEEFGSNKQVTLLVFREGDQLNFFRVVDRGDGTLTPLSESLSGASVYNLNEEEEEEEEEEEVVLVKEKLHDNHKLKEKVQELRFKMENLNLNKKPVPQAPSVHLPQPPSVGVPSNRPIRRQHISSSSTTSLLNKNPLLPPVGQTFSNSPVAPPNINQVADLTPSLSMPSSRKSGHIQETSTSSTTDSEHFSPSGRQTGRSPPPESKRCSPSENTLRAGVRYKILNHLKVEPPATTPKEDTSYCAGGKLVENFDSLDRKVSSATPVSNEACNEIMNKVEISSVARNPFPACVKSDPFGSISCDALSPHTVKSPQKSMQAFSSVVGSSSDGGAATNALSVRDHYSNHKLVTRKVPPEPCGVGGVQSKLKKRQDQLIHNLRDALYDSTAAGSGKETPRSPDTAAPPAPPPAPPPPPSTAKIVSSSSSSSLSSSSLSSSAHCDWKKEFSLESLSSREAYAVTGMLQQASFERIGSSHIGTFLHGNNKSKFSVGNGKTASSSSLTNCALEGPLLDPNQRILSSHIPRITSGPDGPTNLTPVSNGPYRLPPVKSNKKASTKRCLTCGKKTGIASSYLCRCGSNFCALHRYAESHNCTYDYKTEGRKLLEKNNPLVTAPKLPKI